MQLKQIKESVIELLNLLSIILAGNHTFCLHYSHPPLTQFLIENIHYVDIYAIFCSPPLLNEIMYKLNLIPDLLTNGTCLTESCGYWLAVGNCMLGCPDHFTTSTCTKYFRS
jgi:hypothetical protein